MNREKRQNTVWRLSSPPVKRQTEGRKEKRHHQVISDPPLRPFSSPLTQLPKSVELGRKNQRCKNFFFMERSNMALS